MQQEGGADAAVLVVDDDASVRSSMADVLRTAGYQVFEAEDGFVALQHLRRTMVAAMVLDVRMPVLDGLELLDRLDDPPPVVLVTAMEYGAGIARRRDKIFAFVQKPVPAKDLLALVARALGGSSPSGDAA